MKTPQVRAGVSVAAIAVAMVSLGAQTPLPQGLASYVSVDAPVVALTRVRLVDGTGAPVRTDQTVILRGARIDSVGPSATAVLPAGAQVLDLSGHTLMPGLVGLHEHTYFGGLRHVSFMNMSGPMLYLAYGITSAMTAGTDFPYHELSLRRVIDAGERPGPRFFIAGPYFDGDASRNPVSLKVGTPEAARRAIAYWGSEGATWVKFMARVTRDVLRAGIEEAHARGMRVTGHLCSVTFTEAAALGIDLLQHGFITNSDYVPGKRPDVCPPENMRVQADVDVDDPAVQASIRSIVENGAAVASTLGAYETFMPGHVLDPRALALLDSGVRREVETTHAAIPTAGFVVSPALLQKMMQWERAFVAAGGLLGAGTDPWGSGFLPGLGNLRNYELLLQAGFPPEQAIQIMTLNGARILGEEQRVGSIAPGKQADLVVVRGDPIRTPGDIYGVVTVFKAGVGYDSSRLREAAAGRVGVN